MTDDATPRRLAERTGKHYCVRCLAEVRAEVYFANDHFCEACSEMDEYPHRSTPDRGESR